MYMSENSQQFHLGEVIMKTYMQTFVPQTNNNRVI